MEIETKTVALPRLNDPLGRDEEDVSRRLRAIAEDAMAGKDDAAEAEAEAVARLIGLRPALRDEVHGQRTVASSSGPLNTNGTRSADGSPAPLKDYDATDTIPCRQRSQVYASPPLRRLGGVAANPGYACDRALGGLMTSETRFH